MWRDLGREVLEEFTAFRNGRNKDELPYLAYSKSSYGQDVKDLASEFLINPESVREKCLRIMEERRVRALALPRLDREGMRDRRVFMKSYYQKNKAHYLEQRKSYYQKHKAHYMELQRIRRAKERLTS